MKLVMPHDHPGLGGRPGEADDMLGADVGGENGGADHEPADMPAGQEVVRG